MLYLLLAVACSSVIGIIFKISEQRESNRYLVTSMNYLTAVVFSGYMLAHSSLPEVTIYLNLGEFIGRLVELFQTNTGLLSSADSVLWSVILGTFTGWIYCTAFIYYQISVRKNGIALSGMFSRLGVLLPMTLSIIVWQEIPTQIQTVGIVLCLFSIVLVNFNFREGERFQITGSLVLLFFFFGIAIFCNKIFQKYAQLELKPLFLFCLFLSALILSLTVSIKYVSVLKKEELLIGFLVGVPNLFASYFLILSLDQIKASIAFPVFSAGTIILMTVVAVIFFSEKITPKNGVAIVLTAFALVLINL
ncbi:MAG: SMR family transporter [Proteobacteria bacterium]|nr:SMR family transporter [Pseudomonadota bacterium]